MRRADRDPDILRALAREYLRAGRRPPPECRAFTNVVEESSMPDPDRTPEAPPAAPQAPKPACACGRPARIRGLCRSCYWKARRAAKKGKANQGPAAPPSKAPPDLGAALDRLRAAHAEAVTALEGAGLAPANARAVVGRLVAG